jgi:hypothetical protein
VAKGDLIFAEGGVEEKERSGLGKQRQNEERKEGNGNVAKHGAGHGTSSWS